MTQEEADALLALPKARVSLERSVYPSIGEKLSLELTSFDQREKFSLDLIRGRIALKKHTMQSRGRTSIILARLDMGGAPHRNPDGSEIGCPHLHVYKEGFDAKWAIPLPASFTDLDNIQSVLDAFMSYCNIIDPPQLDFGLF